MGKVLQALTFGAASLAFSDKKKDPKVAPIPDDQQAQLDKEREAQRKYGSTGRTGSDLTGNSSGTLG